MIYKVNLGPLSIVCVDHLIFSTTSGLSPASFTLNICRKLLKDSEIKLGMCHNHITVTNCS